MKKTFPQNKPVLKGLNTAEVKIEIQFNKALNLKRSVRSHARH